MHGDQVDLLFCLHLAKFHPQARKIRVELYMLRIENPAEYDETMLTLKTLRCNKLVALTKNILSAHSLKMAGKGAKKPRNMDSYYVSVNLFKLNTQCVHCCAQIQCELHKMKMNI